MSKHEIFSVSLFSIKPIRSCRYVSQIRLTPKPLISFAHFENLPVLSMLIIDLDNWMILADVDVFRNLADPMMINLKVLVRLALFRGLDS